MLEIRNLFVKRAETLIVHNLSVELAPGTIHVLMGPNGSGKSTLAYTLLGHPGCSVESGDIFFKGQNITQLPTYERARLGIFLATQYPQELAGVKVITFLKEAHQALTQELMDMKDFHIHILSLLTLVGLDHSFIDRFVHHGFSGGEKKRFELLQLLLFKPQIAVLDEIDSGLDLDGLASLARIIEIIREQVPAMCLLFVTHNTQMLTYIPVDKVHIFKQGTLAASGGKELITSLERYGYDYSTFL